MALTVKQVARLTEPGRYLDQHGLYLQIISPTNRSWLLRYQRNGKERWYGIGPLHTVDLPEARERARQARLQLLDGVDPIDARRSEKASRDLAAAKVLTFEQAALVYFNAHQKKWTSVKHRQQFLSSMKQYVYPIIGKLPIASIDTTLVLKVIEPLWQDKTATANRIRGRLEAILSWAKVRGYRSGDNPAQWRGHLAQVLRSKAAIQKPQHYAALHYSELPDFMAELTQREGIAARALEFTILCAARTGETIGATWEEIDQDNKVWIIPAARMKASKEHRVPLSDRALEILNGLPTERDNHHVFIGGRKGVGLSRMGMASVLSRMGHDQFTVHGFRSSFRDWAAERTNYQNHIVEQALAHSIGNAVERAYRRGDLFDKRIRLMAEWSRYCMTPSSTSSADVIRLLGVAEKRHQ